MSKQYNHIIKELSLQEPLSILEENVKIHLTDPKLAHLHLYFHLSVAGMDSDACNEYMGKTDRSSHIVTGSIEYMMIM